MPAKKSNKRKRTEAEPASELYIADSVTVYSSPGLQPDVKLHVLCEVYHVHSVILKLHSDYFRRFLDSADKEDAPASAQFKYEYTTVVDDDGTWGLEAASKVQALTVAAISRVPDFYQEALAFGRLLNAMYNKPYTIHSYVQLELLARVADFYRAVPVLSTSLTSALMGSPMFKKQNDLDPEGGAFLDCALPALVLAKKLHNAVLFREAFVHAVGLWDRDAHNIELYEHRDIECLILREHVSLCQKVMDIQQAIMVEPLIMYRVTNDPTMRPDLDEYPFQDVLFFRGLAHFLNSPAYTDFQRPKPVELLSKLAALLENNLVLDRSDQFFNSEEFSGYFLCARLEDHDLPWIGEADF